LFVEKVISICATGKRPAGVVAAQKFVISKEKLMAICYWTWFNSRTVASVRLALSNFTVCALD
jgi:hypothetical protein